LQSNHSKNVEVLEIKTNRALIKSLDDFCCSTSFLAGVECQKIEPSISRKRILKEFRKPISLFVVLFCSGPTAPQKVTGVFRAGTGDRAQLGCL